jgi:hypothetical protein
MINLIGFRNIVYIFRVVIYFYFLLRKALPRLEAMRNNNDNNIRWNKKKLKYLFIGHFSLFFLFTKMFKNYPGQAEIIITNAQTYTSGFNFSTNDKVTKHNIYNLCNDLNEVFEKKLFFQPEKITEGGLLVTWPDQRNEYKTIRFVASDCSNRNWPWISDDPMKSWKNNNDVIWPIPDNFRTVLKAFDGAPSWTNYELGLIAKCMTKHLFIVDYDTFPNQDDTIEAQMLVAKPHDL